MRGAIYLCGGDFRPGLRDDCPDALHDWPLPAGYVDAAEVAGSRLNHGWSNVKCRRCGIYGWRPGRPTPHGDRQVRTERGEV